MSAIKRIREQKGISQKDFAEALGVTPGAVSHWEQGRRKPGIDDLIAIAKLLECKVDDLISDA